MTTIFLLELYSKAPLITKESFPPIADSKKPAHGWAHTQTSSISDDESEIFKYCRGENNFFDVVKNEPQYSIINLEKMYRRLFVITGSPKYMECINYLNIIEQTKFKFETEILRSKLHSKLENEPECIQDFINKL